MLQHLNTLIGFAAVFAIFSLLVTSVTQLIRSLGKLKTSALIERLLRLFGELKDPERFVAAILCHPSLEGRRGLAHYALLTDPTLPNEKLALCVATILGRGTALKWWVRLWRKLQPWPATVDLDKQTVKDIGQSVYEAIGHVVDHPLEAPKQTNSDAFTRWAWNLKGALDAADLARLKKLAPGESTGGEQPAPSILPTQPSAVAPFRGRMWMLAASAFPEAEGKAPPLKTYVAAFHDEAQASASDAFTFRIRLITVLAAAAVVVALQLDAIAVWNRAAQADAKAVQEIANQAAKLEKEARTPASATGVPEPDRRNPPAKANVTTAPDDKVGKAETPGLPTRIEAAGSDATRVDFAAMTKAIQKVRSSELLPAEGETPTFWGAILALAALSLGAPFWFEVLKSAIQLKSAFTKSDK